ncbi:MAG TPA: acyl-CoA dehydrogenase family protein, partial [Rhizomicrobium sp.]|nr:acyl-CoA dehydrogenase family protein [Rhizomicrobium sp.]
MDFSFSEEQTLLRNSVQKYLADNYKFEDFKKISRSEPGYSAKNWKQFAELGLMAAPLPEAHGGLGGGPVDVMVVMEEFGKALVVEPYVSTVVVGGGFVGHGGSDAQKEEWLNKIAAGDTIIAFAFAEPQGRFNYADLTTTAKKNGNNYVLNGQKAVVLGGPWADTLIVTARTAGGQRDAKGVSVFIVDKKSKGITCRDYPTIDGLHASEITFENVEVPAANLIGAADNGLKLIEQVTDEAIAAHASEAVGAMKVLVDTTVEYSKTRKQFGVPIGKFQALQHHM